MLTRFSLIHSFFNLFINVYLFYYILYGFQASDTLPMNFAFTGKGNTASPEGLV